MGWQPGETAPRDGRWFVGKLYPKFGFSGEEYPPAVMRLTGPHHNFKTGENDGFDIEAKALNSGTHGGFHVDDIWLWAPLDDLPTTEGA